MALRIVAVDETLAKFLKLGEREPFINNDRFYCDMLTPCYLVDWAWSEGRVDPENRRVFKIYGEDDVFVQLFKKELDELGCTDTVPFNKCLRIFKDHYVINPSTGQRLIGPQSLSITIFEQESERLLENRRRRARDYGWDLEE